jgi:hypothetical protein
VLKHTIRASTSVDKYGRVVSRDKISPNLTRFYRIDDSDQNPEPSQPDYARGEASEESSDDEDTDRDLERSTLVFGQASATTPEHTNPRESADLDVDVISQPTSRLAVVNLDWDHISASDIYAIFSSQLSQLKVSPVSTLVSVAVYPSEYGTTRMAEEAVHGPLPDIFRSSSRPGENSGAPEDATSENIDQSALRIYQLERLR